MKRFFFAFAFLFLMNSYSQSSSINDISDYSYFLFDIEDNIMHQGTGFFIEKNNQTYLVTASHNFFQDKSAEVKTTDSFYIRLYKKETNEVAFLKIANTPIPKPKKEKNLDINFYKLDIPQIYILKTIEINLSCTPSSIICYGFGVVDGNEDNPELYIKNLNPTEFKGNLKFEYTEPILYYGTNEVDSNNYVAAYVSETLKNGTSGSPVFTYCSKDGILIQEFAGLIHERNEETKLATILRPEIIVQLIDEL